MDEAKDAFLGLLATLEGDELLSFETFVGAAIEERMHMINKEYEDQQQHAHDDDHEHHAGCNHDHNTPRTVETGHVPRTTGAKIFKLNKIIQDLRERLPIHAEAPNEAVSIPSSEEFEGYTKDNMVHVDGFLYTEDDVDELCDQGKLSRNYCLNCGSKETRPLNFISHSASVVQLQFLFQVLLKQKITPTSTILDVGSRLGAVLYAGYLFSDAKKLIGIEMNEYFSKLQRDMVRRHRLDGGGSGNEDNRIEIIHDNLLNRPQLIESADVIIMNNVFQFFSPVEVQRQLWQFLYQHLKNRKGAILVTLPSLQEQLKDAGLTEPIKKKNKKKKGPAKPPGVIAAEKAAAAAEDKSEQDGGGQSTVGNWSSWLREIEVRVTGEEFVEEMMEDDLEQLKLIHIYEVL
ncbi:hypothetical protein BG004_001414 [Podila humilis]|nr:hypothetical protein BG004_001414 [Podila humilis]